MCLSLVFLNHSGGPVQKQIIMSVVKNSMPYLTIFLCFSGEDISVCVCLAILMSLFDEEGTFLCIFNIFTKD